jgi:hypothetical protein
VLRRGYSPRILSANVLGSGGTTLVSGSQLASRLGLYGTWAYCSARSGVTLSAMPDRSGRTGVPAPGLAEAPLAAGGGVSAGGEAEVATARSSSRRSGGTSAPASATTAAYSRGTPRQIAWVRSAASRFVRAELQGDGAGACAVLVAKLRATRGGVSCAARWDALLRAMLRNAHTRAQLRRDAHAIGTARVEVRASLATIALPAALMHGASRFRWTENCWMLEP